MHNILGMNRSKQRRSSVALVTACICLLSACVTSDGMRKDVEKATSELTKGPQVAPYRSVTNFSNAVRCMDATLQTFGVRDVSIIVEDLDDATKKVSTGTKDMLLTTMSDMTRRSRAIKFIAYGGDTKNLGGFLAQAEKKEAFAIPPQFGIRGSITQFEDSLSKMSKDVGIGLGELLTLGKSASSSAKVVALDLTVLNASDFSLVPGVASRNAVALFSQSDGLDGEARYKKLGINYTTNLTRNDGTTIAMRNLVELASIELIGKLVKVPYWKCLGSAPDDTSVRTEVEDWFEGMISNQAELFAYFQYQMSMRGLYSGAVDGVPTPVLSRAIREYKGAMGITVDAQLNADFFYAYLNADHNAAMAKLEADKDKSKRVPATPIAAEMRGNNQQFRPGEKVAITLTTNTPSHAHCFMQDDNRAILRVVPNRFARDSYTDAQKPIQIPGSRGGFSINANNKAIEETVECYVAHKDHLNDLPDSMRSTDLEPLKGVKTLEEVRAAIEKASPTPVAVARFAIKVRR